ncbi:Flp family type IVb pilin [Paenibacillus sp.]|uniref:Flp family type IVb pilin n=1 Tax=Paenibacillus sp. TaxID=58172 RepID=UPI002D608E7F|nr:Flp family type IVb pilin [Paenibacillus sp.]HZG58582.1 Flp family type IVb pilin [Paenibacillus sp.]
MMNKFKALLTDEQGQGLTEYGLVLGIIAVAVVGLIAAFRNEITAIFNQALTDIRSRGTPTEPTT